MPIFEYQALDARGKSVKGIIDAESERGARQRLRAGGVYPTRLVEGSGAGAKAGAVGAGRGGREWMARVSNQDLALMTRQLSTLIKAAIPLVEALTALIDQVENLKLKKTLTRVRDRVNEGSTLADALRDHPKIFSNLYVNMIHAGESSGTLDIVLGRLSEFTQNQMQLVGRVRGAMVYPALMVVMMTAVVLFLATFVIPKISAILADMGQALPWYTRVMMAGSDLIKHWGWALGLGAAALGAGLRRWFATEGGRARKDRGVLRLPLFGPLVRKVAIARFARTLSTLLNGGVPILTAMRIVRNVVDNTVLAAALDNARDAITEGSSIAGPLKSSGMFPPMVIHMIAIGEKSGELEDMLNQIAEAYEFEVSVSVDTMTKVMEPVLLLALAAVVGFIVFSVLVPLMNMTKFN